MSWTAEQFEARGGCPRFDEEPARHRHYRRPSPSFASIVRESLDKTNLRLEREAAAAGFDSVIEYLRNKIKGA